MFPGHSKGAAIVEELNLLFKAKHQPPISSVLVPFVESAEGTVVVSICRGTQLPELTCPNLNSFHLMLALSSSLRPEERILLDLLLRYS